VSALIFRAVLWELTIFLLGQVSHT
jgi:hypothetical protein